MNISANSALPDDMEAFPAAPEPDEGYSEHPLYPSSLDSVALARATADSDPAEFLTWLSPRLSNLTVEQKTRLAMSLLNELPTTVIADIVLKQLNPRLYIDFVDYLPTEICLKIFGYLDPLSLICVAQSCRGWYNLALDRKLWEKLFYLEGWRAVTHEIVAAERRMNTALANPDVAHPQRLRSSEYGHVHKKRAISDPNPPDLAADDMEIDADEDTEMAGTSLFGGGDSVQATAGSASSSRSTTSVVQHLGHLVMDSPSPMPESEDLSRIDVKGKGKGKAVSQVPSIGLPSLPRSTLWTYDGNDARYKINWQYLYAMRRRLEYNWEAGRFANFQLPHPDYLHEGHNECVYSLQYDAEYLVSGSRDKSIRVWSLQSRRLLRKLWGHRGSVLCLQFDSDPEEDLIVSGSSDSDVILWKFSTGEKIQVLNKAHSESVLNVKFDKRILVTCSKDRSIKIFNRKPLRAGDLGYGDTSLVNDVPINLRNYGYDDSPWDQLPIKPAYTQIGRLDGHSAAVNAVQIHGNEIVSASGDRNIKVWDWPKQICTRTFQGHNKGIACVQYDGRRIISGSSDNEVKVFDRETGLEVATLRGHGNLVRTVQAGFGDFPYSVEEDRITAQAIDEEYFAAVKSGALGNSQRTRGKEPNAGSRRPEDITAYGAKLPPGGGGGPYGRIVSGSYDQTVMIWRRSHRDGKWRNVHVLPQADAAANAVRQARLRPARAPSPGTSHAPGGSGSGSGNVLPSLHHNARPPSRHPAPPPPPASAPPALQTPTNITHIEHPIHATVTPQSAMSFNRMIETYVPQGPAVLQNALTSFPTMLAYHSHIQAVIDQMPDPLTRSQLRQVVAVALQRAQLAQSRIRDSVQQAMATSSSPSSSAEPSGAQGSSSGGQAASSRSQPQPQEATQPLPNTPPTARTTLRSASSLTTSSIEGGENASTPSAAAAAPATPSTSTVSTAAPSAAPSAAPVSGGPPAMVTPASQDAQQQNHHQQQQHHQTQQPQPSAAPPPATLPVHHPHIPQPDTQAPRVFKLQFDAHKIICCSQTSTIVGWDFCNGDPELEEAVRFFAPIE
jgi:F-box and WD-40 domain protein 1/11